MTRRENAIALARIAGYHNDMRRFVRLLVEERVNRQVMNESWARGVRMKEAGVRCECFHCKRAAGAA